MGRETKAFRQTKRAGSADFSAKNYARINRAGSWRILNWFKKGFILKETRSNG